MQADDRVGTVKHTLAERHFVRSLLTYPSSLRCWCTWLTCVVRFQMCEASDVQLIHGGKLLSDDVAISAVHAGEGKWHTVGSLASNLCPSPASSMPQSAQKSQRSRQHPAARVCVMWLHEPSPTFSTSMPHALRAEGQRKILTRVESD